MRTLKSVLYDHAILLVIALLSLAGSKAIVSSKRWGPWAYSDSTAYIVSARTFLEEGRLGYYVPSGGFERLTHHPPLYPLVLSAIGIFGVELLDAARWLNVVLFGATIFATGAFTYHLLRSSWLAISLSAAMFVIPTLVDIYSGAMSEPFCFFTSVVGTFMLVVFLETRQRRYLILAASAAGMAFLTRYIGVFAIAAGLIALLALSHSTWKERLKNLVLYGLVSVVPNAIWWLYVYLNTASYGARQVVARADLGKALAHRPDALIVANPTALHLDVAILAAEAGCHILIEKPISHSLDRVDELTEALQRGGGQCLVGFQFRFHPGLLQVKSWLEA